MSHHSLFQNLLSFIPHNELTVSSLKASQHLTTATLFYGLKTSHDRLYTVFTTEVRSVPVWLTHISKPKTKSFLYEQVAFPQHLEQRLTDKRKSANICWTKFQVSMLLISISQHGKVTEHQTKKPLMTGLYKALPIYLQEQNKHQTIAFRIIYHYNSRMSPNKLVNPSF